MSIEDRLAGIRELERAPLSASVTKEFGKALSGANNVLVAKAAQVVERRGIRHVQKEAVFTLTRKEKLEL